jgi:hypothetical protein
MNIKTGYECNGFNWLKRGTSGRVVENGKTLAVTYNHSRLNVTVYIAYFYLLPQSHDNSK